MAAVMKKPDGSRPGVSILASRPMTNPINMVQMIPIAVLPLKFQASNLASIVIRALSSFDTGHPVFALFAISWNVAPSAPGILAVTVR